MPEYVWLLCIKIAYMLHIIGRSNDLRVNLIRPRKFHGKSPVIFKPTILLQGVPPKISKYVCDT